MTEFVAYPYPLQPSDDSAPVPTNAGADDGEEGSFSRGPFSYVAGDTSSGLVHVGWVDKGGDDIAGISAPVAKVHFAVMEKFLFIPGDGTLAEMSLTIMQKMPQNRGGAAIKFPFRFIDDNDVAAAFSISVVQVDRQNLRRSPTKAGQKILYGPETFAVCSHRITKMRPVDTADPDIPVYLRVVSVLTSNLVSWTSDDIYAGLPPTYAAVPVTSGFDILYSIPVSVSRIAR